MFVAACKMIVDEVQYAIKKEDPKKMIEVCACVCMCVNYVCIYSSCMCVVCPTACNNPIWYCMHTCILHGVMCSSNTGG